MAVARPAGSDHAVELSRWSSHRKTVIARSNPPEPEKCWEVAPYGRAVHFESDRAGKEVPPADAAAP